MSTGRAHEAAMKMVETMPAVMQSIMSEIRRDTSMPLSLPQFRILHILVHHAHNLSDLAELTRVSLPTMSNTVSVLVDRGLVERVSDPEDRRRIEITVTDEGREVLAACEKGLIGLLESRLASIGEEELEALITAFDVLRKGFGTRHAPLSCSEAAE